MIVCLLVLDSCLLNKACEFIARTTLLELVDGSFNFDFHMVLVLSMNNHYRICRFLNLSLGGVVNENHISRTWEGESI